MNKRIKKKLNKGGFGEKYSSKKIEKNIAENAKTINSKRRRNRARPLKKEFKQNISSSVSEPIIIKSAKTETLKTSYNFASLQAQPKPILEQISMPKITAPDITVRKISREINNNNFLSLSKEKNESGVLSIKQAPLKITISDKKFNEKNSDKPKFLQKISKENRTKNSGKILTNFKPTEIKSKQIINEIENKKTKSLQKINNIKILKSPEINKNVVKIARKTSILSEKISDKPKFLQKISKDEKIQNIKCLKTKNKIFKTSLKISENYINRDVSKLPEKIQREEKVLQKFKSKKSGLTVIEKKHVAFENLPQNALKTPIFKEKIIENPIFLQKFRSEPKEKITKEPININAEKSQNIKQSEKKYEDKKSEPVQNKIKNKVEKREIKVIKFEKNLNKVYKILKKTENKSIEKSVKPKVEIKNKQDVKSSAKVENVKDKTEIKIKKLREILPIETKSPDKIKTPEIKNGTDVVKNVGVIITSPVYAKIDEKINEAKEDNLGVKVAYYSEKFATKTARTSINYMNKYAEKSTIKSPYKKASKLQKKLSNFNSKASNKINIKLNLNVVAILLNVKIMKK